MRSAVLLLLITGVAYPLVVGFHQEPLSAQLSGWTHRGGTVAQILTINFDELDAASGAYVELFAGEYGSGGHYDLSVRTYPGGTEIATRPNGKYLRPQYWVLFDSINVTYPESIIKGKKLAFCFTRALPDTLQYYFTNASGYNYGGLIAPYPGALTPTHGLAMRCFGRMRPVDSTYWGVDDWCFVPWYSPDSANRTRLRKEATDLADSAGVGTMMIYARWPELVDSTDTTLSWSEFDAHLWEVESAG